MLQFQALGKIGRRTNMCPLFRRPLTSAQLHGTTGPKNTNSKIAPAVERLLNVQIGMESSASHYYLACASISEQWGMKGVSTFMYTQASEERSHLVRLMHFINSRGGNAMIQEVLAPPLLNADEIDISSLFAGIMQQEEKNTASINRILEACLECRDHISYQFVQWYAAEQIEEEYLIHNLLEKIRLIGKDKAGIYCFDRDLLSQKMVAQQHSRRRNDGHEQNEEE